MNTAVIVPCYNEEKTVGNIVQELRKNFSTVIVIDDGSTDSSAELATKTGAIVLKHKINVGQGAALQTGIFYALSQGFKYIATFDADGQHQVSDLIAMVQMIQRPVATGTDKDVILGSRFLSPSSNSIPFTRKFLLKMGVLFTNLTTGLKLTDTHNGLRVFNAQSLKKLRVSEFRMSHASELLEYIAIYHLRYSEYPVKITYASSPIGIYKDMIRVTDILFQFLASKVIRT